MNNEEYKLKGETLDKGRKVKYWECAIGLQKVDGLTPSPYLIDLAQQNIDGKITYKEVENLLYTRYENETEEERFGRVKEGDLVSTRIADILDGGGFSLNPESLRNIHGILFKDLYSHAGKFRDVNLTKEEPILNGNTVVYADWRNIRETLDYDFTTEREKPYIGLSNEQVVKRIANFTSAVWQVHPFREGNTRTTAVLMQSYLSGLRFKVDNETFKHHSLYFRNSLVISNYGNVMEGIAPDNTPLIKFYENLLTNAHHQLRNRDLFVLKCFPENLQKEILSLQEQNS